MIYAAILPDVHWALRTLLIVALAVVAHLAVRLLHGLSRWLMAHSQAAAEAPPSWKYRADLAQLFPRAAALVTVLVSAATFSIYFLAIGALLSQVGVSLTAYLASASVIGLAVAFGSQGFVQDVVTGLTLIFSDVLSLGDLVEVSGQTGRVERIGLRFTTLTNLLGQQVFVPNRTIGTIGRFQRGAIQAYVDLQVPSPEEEPAIRELALDLARSFRDQHAGLLLGAPRDLGVRGAGERGWRYLRLELPLWPAQGGLIEGPFKQRLIAALKQRVPDYAEWMVTITYRVADASPATAPVDASKTDAPAA